ncbi:hypothetical protein M5S04_04980 [Avibacterium paragallinarum]|uniref:DUF308 domain-containing protein n=1 Tax=Avibacterium paragallinarum TaxID=728 RepID=UPI002285EB42|nr:hypothetical protein [Avibacterium paragallinarum]WAM58856.1 hypothetical protein OW731_09985 [Avibacterium paragallinarum]
MFQVLFSGFGSIFSILFLFLLPKFVLTMLFIIMPLGYLAFLGIAASFAFLIVLENRIIKWCASFGICLLIFGMFSILAIFFVKPDNHTPIWISAFCGGFFTLIGIITAFAFIIEKLNQRKKAKEKAKIENSANNEPLLLEPTEKTPSDLIVSSEQKEETSSNLIIPLTQTENSLDTPISLPPQKEKRSKKRKRTTQAENNLTPEKKHQRKTDDIKLRILECERRIAELKKQELEYKLKSLEALEKYREIKRKNTSSNKK